MSKRDPSPFIGVRGLRKTYGEGDGMLAVLEDVDLQVEPGQCVALLGRSGSGKSTLLNLLAGIDRPDAGEIRIDGVALHRLSERDRTLFRRRHVGFVYQFFNLIPTLTVAENVALPMELNGFGSADTRLRTGELLADLGLDGRDDTFPEHLSGGEQQRVAIARALAHKPKLLLADEPTGNLDAESGRQVLDMLLQGGRKAGHTLILVTHSMTVAQAADRVLVLEEGRVHENGERWVW